MFRKWLGVGVLIYCLSFLFTTLFFLFTPQVRSISAERTDFPVPQNISQNVSQFSRARKMCCGKKFCCSETKIFFCLKSKTFSLPGSQMLLSKHRFPSLATMKTMSTRFQCCSLKMLRSNGKQRTMADGEVEVEEKRRKDRNWKDEETELLIALYDCCGM